MSTIAESRSKLLSVTVIFAMFLAILPVVASPARAAGPPVFINEIHYDNTGTDAGEFIEIAGPAGTDLTAWNLVLYNGSGGAVYDTDPVNATIPLGGGFGVVVVNYPVNGIQNGAPDGIALVDDSGTVVQFLSYEGSFTAVGGPADGLTSTDIGVSETGTEPVGQSLQLTGTGTGGDDFTWTGPATATSGAFNTGQTFGAPTADLSIDCGADVVIDEGTAFDGAVTAVDPDDTATITLVSDDLGGGLAVGTQTGGTVPGETATLPFAVADTVPAGAYTATFRAVNGAEETADCTLSISVEAPAPVVEIWEIQGTEQFSAFAGQTVRTRGVVTLVDSSGTDAWIQTPTADTDGDPATSDGILIDDYNTLAGPPAVGDLIVIEGVVQEQQFNNELPRTRIDNTVLISNEGPTALPDPVPLVDLPDESVADGIVYWEALESMLVSAQDGVVVAPTNGFGEFAFLTQADAVSGSGFEPSTSHILLRSLGPNEVDYNPERVAVDDDGQVPATDVRPGDTVNSAVGVVDYTFGVYKLQLSSLDVTTSPLPDFPVSERSRLRGANTTITTFNVENLFDLFDDPDKDDTSSTPTPAASEIELTKLALAIEHELKLPEIMILQEVENTFIAQQLGNRVNEATGTDYVATSFETSDARGIEVAFLWDAKRVDLLEAFQLSGPDVEAAFGPPSASPGREPLYGKFRIGKDMVHIVGNHFKSKSGDDPIFGVSFNRVTEEQRKLQARVVRDFVDTIFEEDRNALVMVAGDLNDFQFGEPGEGAGHPLAILEGSGHTALTNLIEEEDQAERWSFVFDGNSQVLDHMLVSRKLESKMRGADFLHFNAGYPASASSDPGTTIGSADHDPLEGRFRFNTGKSPGKDGKDEEVRFSTYNASLNRNNAGELIADLTGPNDAQAAKVAEAIQRIRPDVLLINEFDFDPDGTAMTLFQDNYLSISQNGALPIHYPYRYAAPSNTGVPSGFDLDNSGSVGGPNDAFGFGFFEGQFAFVVYSMYPIGTDELRTFQNFLWNDMPDNLVPDGFFSDEELAVLRLSSKNHVDLPIEIEAKTVHFLVSHPTPPVFDGPEDRNGTRNFDEIRFWADYVDPARSGYIYDDNGVFGGLERGAKFVIAGDQNSDPFDGDSIPGSAQLLLDHPLINDSKTPSSEGGPEAAAAQGGANLTHVGDPAFDTADFNDTDPGNLRADYVLPSARLRIADSSVFWPTTSDPLVRLIDASDHRLVWVDVTTKSIKSRP
jgi:predicted extracellular nuclease